MSKHKIEWADPEELTPDARNPRLHSDDEIAQLRAMMDEVGFTNPILLRAETGIIGAGHKRRLAALLPPKIESVPFIRIKGLSDAQWKALVIADNQLALVGGWDEELLAQQIGELAEEGFDIGLLGFDNDWMDGLLHPESPPSRAQSGLGSLSERFMAVPFSVLNAREGWWQERKKQWLEMGIQSEIGRDGNLLKMSETILEAHGGSGTSVFDPVLAELAYRWFSPPKGLVLDPFAGGSVRGIVASKLGRAYIGCELRPEQCAANRAQAEAILGDEDEACAWEEGDARQLIGSERIPEAFDFIFSCPPYGPLEKYSDLPGDLSNMAARDFERSYRAIIHQAMARLKEDRFAAFVVGDYREKGILQDFISLTIEAFGAAGGKLYNRAILVTMVGNLAMRAGRTFAASRKLGSAHQDLLVFVKGDWKKACAALGSVEIDKEALEEALEAEGEPSPALAGPI